MYTVNNRRGGFALTFDINKQSTKTRPYFYIINSQNIKNHE